MRRKDEAPDGSGTRLVYSTGGAAPAGKAADKAPAAAGLPRAAGGKGIRLRLEARPGGRAVTIVLGLQGTSEEIAALARELKAACGTGGTVKDGVIELQGDHRESAQAALSDRGLKARI